LLEGKKVNLKVVEKEDLPNLLEWFNNYRFLGEYNPLLQKSKIELERNYDKLTSKRRMFFIEKKEGNKIGFINYFAAGELMEIGFFLIPSERGKGYCLEATNVIVDYLFLSKDIVRVQAHTDVRNAASQKVLEKAGFKKEATIRKSLFIREEWRDLFLYSLLREEWKEPKVLTK
jgi:RimJ/RimL family protein N-acetyltransferase